MNKFKAFQVNNVPHFHTSIIDQEMPLLSANEVLVKVAYSDVNYKDALASSESGGVIRSYPMTSGIDLSGTVVESRDERFKTDDSVLLTGYGLGVTQPGGYSQYQKVSGDWLIPLPKTLSLRQAMVLGTAGFTALLCVNALITKGMKTSDRIVVTGASGGVGSTAVAILKKLGFTSIIALSRKKESVEWLKKLGANEVLSPNEFLPEKTKPLGKQQIDYVIDIGQAKMHHWDYIKEEMESIVSICREHNVISKVIFENCYLEKDEIKQVALIAKEVKPDFIKTSTGFGTGGATLEDVQLMVETVEGQVKVKAAGGIRDWKTCKAMIDAGAQRIGTSSSLKILEEFEAEAK